MRRQRNGGRWRIWRRGRGTRCNTSYDAFYVAITQTFSPKNALPSVRMCCISLVLQWGAQGCEDLY